MTINDLQRSAMTGNKWQRLVTTDIGRILLVSDLYQKDLRKTTDAAFY